MTDWSSKWQNKFIILVRKSNGKFKTIQRIRKVFPKNELYKYNICLKKSQCYKFIIRDKKKNGLGKGWYKIYWGGKERKHPPFKNGAQQIRLFGRCWKKQ